MPTVLGYTCPECGYSKSPTNHSKSSCNGIVVKVGDGYKCDACGATIDGALKCAKCGHKIKEM